MTKIPGLPAQATAPAEKTRRPKKQQQPPAQSPTPDVQEEKISASEAINKRIRANTKKLQRIQTYEDQDPAQLNPDQKKAIASKPVLETLVKELKELLPIVKAQEVEDQAQVAQDEKLSEQVAAANDKTTLVFKFISLAALVSPGLVTAFAPPQVPEAVSSLTSQDVAAIRFLFESFATGPQGPPANAPLGAGLSADYHLERIASASPEEVISNTPYSRIAAIIHSLYSPILEPTIPASLPPVEVAPTAQTELVPEVEAETKVEAAAAEESNGVPPNEQAPEPAEEAVDVSLTTSTVNLVAGGIKPTDEPTEAEAEGETAPVGRGRGRGRGGRGRGGRGRGRGRGPASTAPVDNEEGWIVSGSKKPEPSRRGRGGHRGRGAARGTAAATSTTTPTA